MEQMHRAKEWSGGVEMKGYVNLPEPGCIHQPRNSLNPVFRCSDEGFITWAQFIKALNMSDYLTLYLLSSLHRLGAWG